MSRPAGEVSTAADQNGLLHSRSSEQVMLRIAEADDHTTNSALKLNSEDSHRDAPVRYSPKDASY